MRNHVAVGPAGLAERDQKIVEALLSLSPHGPRIVSYEDIVVRAWELFPDDFGLRGYSERFPDASDIHKRLYNALKTKGWVTTAGQKKFSLTRSGWERAVAKAGTQTESSSSGRVGREAQLELEHLERSDAARLYHSQRAGEILDTDFFNFYRTSVRATPQEFSGRLAEVSAALDEADVKGLPAARMREVHMFLQERFKSHIEAIKERGKREG